MRRHGFAALVVLAALGLGSGRAGANVPPTTKAPVVVAGVPVTLDEAKARAGRQPAPSSADVAEQLASLVHARWVAGEAVRRGVVASATRVAVLVARAQRSAGGAERWRRNLARRGIPEAQARAQIEERVLREALVDAITAGAGDSAQRWGRTMDDFNRRWRASTACAAGLRGPVRISCGNFPRSKDRCAWYAIGEGGLFGLGDLCHSPREWTVDVDLVEQFYPRSDPGELACVPQGDDALDRLERYLRRTAPSVLRTVFFDDDCDPQFIAAKHRSAMVTTLHAIARIGADRRQQ